jgi:phosphate-selective porin
MKKIVLILLGSMLLFSVLPAFETSTDTAQPLPKLKLSGFGRVRYTVDATAGKTDGFSITQGRFGVNGDISSDFSYGFSIETTNSDTVNNKMLYDLYIDTTIVRNFKIRLGQFKYAFGLEQTTPDADLELINKAEVVNNLVKPTRDIGLQVSRDLPLDWLRPNVTLALFNGSGSNAEDENNRKTLIGRLTLNPLNGLTVGASYYDGTTGTADKKTRGGFELKYENNRLLAKGEYIFGKDKTVNKAGYYVTLGYTVLTGTVVLFRYDWWNANKDLTDLDVSRLTFGVNYFFSKSVLLRTNYELKTEKPSVKNNIFMVQMQVKF